MENGSNHRNDQVILPIHTVLQDAPNSPEMAAGKGTCGHQVVNSLNNSNNQTRRTPALRVVRRSVRAGWRGWLTFVRFIVALRGLVVRVFFVGLTIGIVWTVVFIKREPLYWVLCVLLLPLLADLCNSTRTIFAPERSLASLEKWFSLCIFTYLLCSCPPIWILELHLTQKMNNITEVATEQTEPNFSNTAGKVNIPVRLAQKYAAQIQILHHFPLKLKIRIIEQLHLLCAIIGRWILPLFGISSDQLSELLLINIGSAADILDLFESFNEEAVINNFPLQISILCLWQASLLQFCFNKTSRLEASMSSIPTHSTAPRSLDSGQHNPFQAPTVTDTNQNCCLRCCKRKKKKKETRFKSPHEVEAQARRSKKKAESQVRSSISTAESQSRSSTNTAESQSRSSTSTAESQARSSKKTAESQEKASELTEECTCCCRCWHGYFLQPGHFGYVLFGTELWAIILTLMLQDVPFLILRLMLIFRYNVQSYQNIFFTVKNLLLILAQVFRSTILVQAHWSANKLLGRTRVYRPR